MSITFNGYIERLMELDSLYLSIQKASWFTAEKLLDMFMAGYTMAAPKIKLEGEEALTMQVSYNGFTGELVKLETKMVDGLFYTSSNASLVIYDSEKRVTHSFTGVNLEDVKFMGGEVSFK